MNSKVELSIITPTYNGSKFLAGNLQNVIAQNAMNIEHIIIDGSSSDSSLTILRDYSVRFDHIRWISEPDSGQSDAMNKGIKLARGRVIGFLNVDDYYQPGVLERVIELFAKALPNTIIFGNCIIKDESGRELDIHKPRNISFERMLLGQVIQPYPINPSAYFYHKQLHDIVGNFDVDEHYHMDLDMILRLLQVANVRYVDEHWGNFRYLPGTKTHENIESGGLKKRIDRIIQKYQQHLPLYKKVWILPIYAYAKSGIAEIVSYFIQRPGEFFPRLIKRIILLLRP